MGIVKGIAVWAIFVVGILGLGTTAAVVGGVWTTVALVWLGFWIAVGILAELASPTIDDDY